MAKKGNQWSKRPFEEVEKEQQIKSKQSMNKEIIRIRIQINKKTNVQQRKSIKPKVINISLKW